MKKRNKIVVAILIIALMVVSFSFGRHLAEQENRNARIEHCNTLIKFAIDKAENHDLTDEGTMRGLISNVYAAYQFCVDSNSAKQLHDLWNYLIFEGDSNIDSTKELALHVLNAVLYSNETSN